MRTVFKASLAWLFALGLGCGAEHRPISSDPSTQAASAANEPGSNQLVAVDPGPGSDADPTSKPVSGDDSEPGWGIRDVPEEKVTYAEVVRRVVGMVGESNTRAQVTRRGLDLMNVMWEDTGRFQGSAVGPNISDLTLQVRYTEAGQPKAALLPVIRFPNFTDRTGDVRADRFFIRTGNQKKNGKIETVPLNDVLKNLRAFVSDPNSVLGSGNLHAARDTHYLVSAQAVFLPIPKEGRAEFTPVLFNYQSFPESPAVLTMLVTRQGTSITVIENSRDESSPVNAHGQELFFNKAGERAPFTAERRSDVKQRIEAQGGPKNEDDRSALAKGADVLFVVQVPLMQRPNPRRSMATEGFADEAAMAPPAVAPSPMTKPSAAGSAAKKSDVEQAVLGHGKVEGKFEEGRRRSLVRDTRFPIRITVQFYKATSNGVVSEADLDAIARSIGSVYEKADFVGSLVVPEGDPRRPTEWQTMPRDLFPF
jgi:hypothetical protein